MKLSETNFITELTGVTKKRGEEITKTFLKNVKAGGLWKDAIEKTIKEAKIKTADEGFYLGANFVMLQEEMTNPFYGIFRDLTNNRTAGK